MVANRRIMAAMVVAFFAHLACYPQTYTSGTYTVVDDLIPLRWWGIALAAAGTAMALTRSIHAVVAVTALLAGWVAGLVAAVATGDSQSPAGAAFIAGYVALLICNAGRTASGA